MNISERVRGRSSKELVNSYENFFYFYIAPVFNQIFWIYYFCVYDHQSYNYLTSFLMNHVEPWFMVLQVVSDIFYVLVVLYSSDKATKGKCYSWGKLILFVLGVVPFYFFAVVYQTVNLTIAWMHTLRSSNTHAESTVKTISKSKDK